MAKRKSKGWPRIGSIASKKNDPKSVYLKLNTEVYLPEFDLTLEEDTILVMQKPKDELNRAVEAGRLGQEEAGEIYEKISFIKYNIYVPLSDDEDKKAKSKSKSKTKSQPEDEEF